MWRMSKLFLVHGVVGSVKSGSLKDMGAGLGKGRLCMVRMSAPTVASGATGKVS